MPNPLRALMVEDNEDDALAEAHLAEAQRLEAVGRLTGGIAHDFNNQLTVIRGSAEFLLNGLSPEEPLRRDVERIVQTVDRGAHLVRQLLTFSHRNPSESMALNLADLLSDMAPVLRLLLGERITLRLGATPHLWPVRADRVEMERVIMNLVVNARDALLAPDTRATGAATRAAHVVTLETDNVDLDESSPGMGDNPPPGPHVRLAVSDTGPGMTLEVRKQIFEPFFTTKRSWKGTGLGLATVSRIVQQHGGSISCASERGGGTTFRIYLPRVANGKAATVEAGARNHAPRARSSPRNRTVLLAEDEASLREVVGLALEDSGYRLFSAGTFDEALAVVKETRPIDLLVTDMQMPGGNGHMLARRLWHTYPQMRVLFVSGYSGEPVEPARLADGRFMQKPFGLDEFIDTVDEMLAERQPPPVKAARA